MFYKYSMSHVTSSFVYFFVVFTQQQQQYCTSWPQISYADSHGNNKHISQFGLPEMVRFLCYFSALFVYLVVGPCFRQLYH